MYHVVSEAWILIHGHSFYIDLRKKIVHIFDTKGKILNTCIQVLIWPNIFTAVGLELQSYNSGMEFALLSKCILNFNLTAKVSCMKTARFLLCRSWYNLWNSRDRNWISAAEGYKLIPRATNNGYANPTTIILIGVGILWSSGGLLKC